jgi:hypothetical protein
LVAVLQRRSNLALPLLRGLGCYRCVRLLLVLLAGAVSAPCAGDLQVLLCCRGGEGLAPCSCLVLRWQEANRCCWSDDSTAAVLLALAVGRCCWSDDSTAAVLFKGAAANGRCSGSEVVAWGRRWCCCFRLSCWRRFVDDLLSTACRCRCAEALMRCRCRCVGLWGWASLRRCPLSPTAGRCVGHNFIRI